MVLLFFFIGRKTEYTPDKKWEQGKYKKLLTHSEKNSFVSETVENRFFYGEDSIKGYDYLIITEGITDAIMAHQAGFPFISPVTVRFRESDKKKLEYFARRVDLVYIANDNEENSAGKKGAWNTAEYLMSRGLFLHEKG